MLGSFVIRGLRPNFLKVIRCKSSGGFSLNVEMLSQDKTDYIYIEAISQLGFRLNNKVRIIGPMVAFPKTLLQWNVNTPEELAPAAFSLFTLLEPKLDLLIVGVGDKDRMINPSVIDYLQTNRQVIQVLPTSQAVGLFNFLNREDRFVAAALIPPQTVVDAMSVGIEDTQNILVDNEDFMGQVLHNRKEDKDDTNSETGNGEIKENTSSQKTPGGLFFRGFNTSAPKTPGGVFDRGPGSIPKSDREQSGSERDSFKEVSTDSIEERRRKIKERLQASKKSNENKKEGTTDSDKPS